MQANPVIIKELRGRMRGWRAAVVLSFYLLVLSGVTMLFYMLMRSTSQYAYGGTESAQFGKFIFSILVVFQTIMVCLLTPAFTAGAITSEREQRTYDLLMTTLLPARSVIFGKLGAALAYVLLLIVSIAPLESLAFMFGGVSPEEIILSQVVMFFAAVMFASIGIFWSSILRSSVGSNVLTYGTILFQLIGIPLLFYVLTTTAGWYNYNPVSGSTPFTQTEGYWYLMGGVLSSNPLAAMIMSEGLLLKGDPLFVYYTTTLLNGRSLFVISPWLLFCIEALILSAFLVLFSIRIVRPVQRKVSPGYASDAYAPYAPDVAQVPPPAQQAAPFTGPGPDPGMASVAQDVPARQSAPPGPPG